MGDDGTEELLSCEGLFAPLADRVAFERRFGVSAVVLSRISEMFYDEADPEVQLDPSRKGQLREDADASGLHEEWIAFLVWRVLARKAGAGAAAGTFEEFLERVGDVVVENLDEETQDAGPADPELDPTPAGVS
jgi:hypothetical protein